MLLAKKKSISLVVSKQEVVRRLSTGVWRENAYIYTYTHKIYMYTYIHI